MSAIVHALAALFAGLQGPTVPAGPLTIDQAADLAVKNAFAVRIQRTAVEKSRQLVKASQAQLGPTFSGSLEYLQNTEAIKQNFGQFSVTEQPIDVKTGGLSLTLPIDIAGNQRRTIRANQAAFRASQRTLDAQFDEARLSARTLYLGVLRAQATVDVDKIALKDATERLKQAQQQFSQQEVAKIDVMAFETNVSQANSDLLVAQNDLAVAKESLNYQLAIPIETVLETVDIPDLPPVITDADQLVKIGLERRPDVKAIRETITQLANIRRATEAGMDPSLALGVNLSSTFNPLPGDLATTTNATLTLTVPFFDSGLTRARVKAARQDEAAEQIQLDQAVLGVSQDVRSALSSLISARARFANATDQVKYAQETYRLAKIKQDAGEGTYVETIDAENNLSTARNLLLNARYDYLTAYAQLEKATGADLLPKTSDQIPPAPVATPHPKPQSQAATATQSKPGETQSIGEKN